MQRSASACHDLSEVSERECARGAPPAVAKALAGWFDCPPKLQRRRALIRDRPRHGARNGPGSAAQRRRCAAPGTRVAEIGWRDYLGFESKDRSACGPAIHKLPQQETDR